MSARNGVIVKKRISLKQAIDFHGHLGPYLMLGLLMGEYALKKLKAKPHFGLEVKVWGAAHKPKSCLIDGLQLSTGCTYGKGNITKYNGKAIKVSFVNCENKQSLTYGLNVAVDEKLSLAHGHRSCEKLANELYKTKPEYLFSNKADS